MTDLAATVFEPPRAKHPWRLEDSYPASSLRYYAHGRNALTEALTLAGVAGGRVLLPGLVCREVLASVRAAGAEPVFHAIGPDLKPSEDQSRWPPARAAVAVDYFGFPQDLAPYRAYAHRCGARLVEDAAHALFSRDELGSPLGARLPLGVLSLRKSLPLPDGGVLLADPTYATRLPPQLPFRPAGLRAALKAAARHPLGTAGAKAAHRALSVFRALRGDVRPAGPDAERVLPSAFPCAALERPLDCADPSIEASRRRALWAFCDGIARRAGLTPAFPALPRDVVPYAYALRAADLGPARRVFAAEGLTVLPWPDLPEAVAPSAPAHYRDLGLVHFLW